MTIGDETDAPGPAGAPPPVPDSPPEPEGPGLAKTRREPDAPPPATPEAPPAEPDKNSYRVKLPAFEGPLDLLLHLIQKHELDILDIPIGFVTEKYVEFIILMEELNIDIASEYLVMAATLAHIKSKMLLPTPPEDQDSPSEEEEDPRAELVRRLLEYQKYRLAGEELGSRSVLGRDVFPRGTAEAQDEGPAPLAPTSLFKLMEAFESILKRVQQTQEHQIDFERISITERINQLSDILRTTPLVEFDQLFVGQKTRADVIVTFLALLEMTRLRLTRIAQESPYSPIYVELSVREDGAEGASRLEDFVPTSAAEEAPTPAARDWTGGDERTDEFATDLDDDDELPEFLSGEGEVPPVDADDLVPPSGDAFGAEATAEPGDPFEEPATAASVEPGEVEQGSEADASVEPIEPFEEPVTEESGEPDEPAPADDILPSRDDERAASLPIEGADPNDENTPPESTRGDTEP